MAKSAAAITAEMQAALAAADPEMDTSIGSVLRKIFDVVAEQIAPAYAESDLLDNIFNLDGKSGPDLDAFCSMFGIARLPGRRAAGVITLTRPTPAAEDLAIPYGTQFGTGTLPPVVFATVAPAVLLRGTTKVSVPVQAVVEGGNGNLPGDALTVLITQLGGVSPRVTQTDATSGGSNPESDAALRARFRRTLFRSMAGTEDMFVATALEDSTPDDPTDTTATQVNVLGVSKRWREQVQVVTDPVDGLVALSTLPTGSARFLFTGTTSFGLDIDAGDVLTEGVHYTLNTTTVPPRVEDIGGTLLDGAVYDLEFEYTPTASRNDPANGITNRVDIWVSGVSPQRVSETTYYAPEGTFSATPTDPLFRENFRRLSASSEDPPALGNHFLQLGWGPILSFPDTLVVGADTFVRDTDYWVVHDDTGFGYSPTSRFGLEWSDANAPAASEVLALVDDNSYVYNRVPADVETRARRWKLVTTDVKAHAAKQVRLALNFAITYLPGYERGLVQAGIDAALGEWMGSLGFRSVVQISDLLAVAHAVSGVDNIRLLNSLETSTGNATDWGIQRVSPDGTHLAHYATDGAVDRATDVVLAESEVPVLHDVRFLTKAQNTYTEPTA